MNPGFRRLWIASALSNLADGVFQVALPLLLGFLVVTERRIVEVESAYTPNLSA